jgi:Mor family transcriptional regulator
MKSETDIIRENLTETQREIADIIGFDNYLNLVRFVNGDSIYIPKYSELLRPCVDEEIREKFDGYNFKELAAEYDLTVKSIYNKVSPELRTTTRSRPLDGQTALF